VRLGVFTVLYEDRPFEEALDKIASLGIEAVEIGTGNYSGGKHCDPRALLADREAAGRFRRAVESRGLEISALSQHGNPLHPNADVARAMDETWRATVELAEVLEVSVVIAFSGCPGDHPGARYPNWVTYAWPDDHTEVLEWQWRECVIPYWVEAAEFARQHGVKIAVEMHPNFVVYNPETLLRLREEAGPELGCNFDPSHLFWQQIDPVEAINALGRAGALFHVHAKDTYIDQANTRLNGVLDAKRDDRVAERSWTFRTVGFGQGEKAWRDIVSALRLQGYEGAVSIEHEDALLTLDEGLAKAVELLQRLLPREHKAPTWLA
jgi:sugar phosphate isomerase/epimerase